MPRPGWRRALPTTDFYFASTMAAGTSNARIRRLEQNVFVVRSARGSTVLIIRYISGHGLRALSNTRKSRILFLLDDDVFAAESDPGLPSEYRKRLSRYRRGVVASMESIADEIIAPTQPILNRFHGKPGYSVPPAFPHRQPDMLHHLPGSSRFDIVLNATASHQADIEMIAPQLRAALDRLENATLTTFLGQAAPADLIHPRVRHLPALDWPSYLRFVAANRFHLALAPAQVSAYNSARSPTRILDNAGYGAAGLYSARPPFSQWVEDGLNGLLVEDDEWAGQIETLYRDRELTAALARETLRHANVIGDHDVQRRFWHLRLGLAD